MKTSKTLYISMVILVLVDVVYSQPPPPPNNVPQTTESSTGNQNPQSRPGYITCNPNSFTISTATFPPYCHTREGRVHGAVCSTLLFVTEACCGQDVEIRYKNNYSQIRKIEEDVSDEDIIMPVVKTGLTVITDVDGYLFLPVLETSGSILVRNPVKSGSGLQDTILASWPLAITVLFSATLAGIIVWVLDRYWNPDEFPKSFLGGCWEGTWWAFVTMTTVGYGDRAPKSIPARCFGLVWMFVGIVMMSIFTAALTTALTSSLNAGDEFELPGARICAVKGSLEQILAYKSGATVEAHNTTLGLMEAVKNKECDAGLVDINYALYEYRTISRYALELGDTIPNKAVYGIILFNQNTTVEQCFAREISKASFKVYDEMIAEMTHDYKSRSRNQASETAKNIFSGILPITISVAVLWTVAFMACLLWEFIYHRPKMRREGKDVNGNEIKPDDNKGQKRSCFPWSKNWSKNSTAPQQSTPSTANSSAKNIDSDNTILSEDDSGLGSSTQKYFGDEDLKSESSEGTMGAEDMKQNCSTKYLVEN